MKGYQVIPVGIVNMIAWVADPIVNTYCDSVKRIGAGGIHFRRQAIKFIGQALCRVDGNTVYVDLVSSLI